MRTTRDRRLEISDGGFTNVWVPKNSCRRQSCWYVFRQEQATKAFLELLEGTADSSFKAVLLNWINRLKYVGYVRIRRNPLYKLLHINGSGVRTNCVWGELR